MGLTSRESNKCGKSLEELDGIQLGDKVYYARFLLRKTNKSEEIIASEVVELKVSFIYPECLVGVVQNDKDVQSQRMIVSKKYIGTRLFHDRKETLKAIKQLEKEHKYARKQFSVEEVEE